MNQQTAHTVLEREAPPEVIPVGTSSPPLPAAVQINLPAEQQAQSSDLLSVIARVASDPNVDITKVERLFAMHKDMMALQAKAAYNAAMSRAEAKIQPIVTDAENDHTESRYATLAAINKAIVPLYTAEGLAVSFDTETVNETDPIKDGFIRTVALITHRDGHTERRHIDLPPDATGAQGKVNKTGVQAAGSTNEYARRYLIRMIFNISTYDDTDGSPKSKEERAEVKADPEVKAILDACASKDSLTKAWGKLSKEQRAKNNDYFGVCRKRIDDADRGAAQ